MLDLNIVQAVQYRHQHFGACICQNAEMPAVFARVFVILQKLPNPPAAGSVKHLGIFRGKLFQKAGI